MSLSEYELRVLEEIEYELATQDHDRLTHRRLVRRIWGLSLMGIVVAALITLTAVHLVPGVAATATAAVVGFALGAVGMKLWLQRRVGLRPWGWIEPDPATRKSRRGHRQRGTADSP
jgi:hypothetical protein